MDKIEKFLNKHMIMIRNHEIYLNQNAFAPIDLESMIREDLKSFTSENITENTSDGYHTFKDLYTFRKIYNACLFNEWSSHGKYNVHKSRKHSDGEYCFNGEWFIVVATTPTGDISNHYEMKDWDLFKCEEREFAKEWDGHTHYDVIERLLNIINA